MPDTATVSRAAPPAHPPTTRGAAIASLGAALPQRVVTNEEIGARLGVTDAWIKKRFGVSKRHFVETDGRLADMAAQAGRVAIERAGIDPATIDLVLVGTFTSDEMLPHAAPLVADALGCRGAGALDVGAACASWVAAIVLGASMIETGRAERILVVGAELLSCRVAPDDEKTVPMMADGAGAAILSATDGPARVERSVFHSDARDWPSTQMRRDDQRLLMEGPQTYEIAVNAMTDGTHELLEHAGLEIADVGLFVYHQGNARILDAVGRRLRLKPEQVAHYIAETGNTSSASVPLALEASRRDGRLREGMRVLLGGVGAGYTWALCLAEWGNA
jgi:3-oxoacyl-[acyl-carrier-protein] synthase III